MTILAPAVCRVLLFLSVLISASAHAQVDFRRFEPGWCKPHPDFKPVFASFNFETAHVPVSFNRSVELTGWRTFFNYSVENEAVVPTEALWRHYKRCLENESDSILFEGPTLFCSRMCRNGERVFLCLQSANDGRNYFFTLVEPDRAPPPVTAEFVTKALKETGVFTFPFENASDPRVLSEIARSLNGFQETTRVSFLPANGISTPKSTQRAKAFYEALIGVGLQHGQANYGHLPAGFSILQQNNCGASAQPDRMVLHQSK